MSEQTDMNRGFLKDKLANYQLDPPDKVWDGISGNMGKGSKRRGTIFLLMAVAASLALAITLGVHFFGPDVTEQSVALVESPVMERNKSEAEGSSLEQKVKGTLADIHEDGEAEQEVPKQQTDPALKAYMEESTGLAQVFEQDMERSVDLLGESGQQDETQLSLAMQSIALAEQSEALNEQPVSEDISDPVILLQDEVGDEVGDELPDDLEIQMETAKKRDPRWMLGAALSPLYSFRDADAAAIAGSPAESGLLSYSTGVHVSYRRSSRLAIETGIYYNKTGIAIGAPGIQVFNQKFDNVIFGAGSERTDILTVSNSVGNIVAYSGDIFMNGYKINAENSTDAFASEALDEIQASESGIQQHLDFLELPFNLRYSVIDQTFELQLIGGMSANFLVGNYVTMEGPSGQEEIGYLSNVNTLNYSWNAGLGMLYHMGEKLSLILEPRFRYFLNSVNDSSLPNTRPYSLGFYTGLSYTF